MKKSTKNAIDNAVLAAGCGLMTGLSCIWIKKDVKKGTDKKKPATFLTYSEYGRDMSTFMTWSRLTLYYLKEVVNSIREKN